MTTSTATAAVDVEAEKRSAYTRSLRAFADVLDANPDINLPYPFNISTRDLAEVDRWAAAIRAAGWEVIDRTDDHDREVSSPSLAAVRIVKVHDEPMRRHRAGLKFLAEHAAEVDALAAEPVSA